MSELTDNKVEAILLANLFNIRNDKPWCPAPFYIDTNGGKTKIPFTFDRINKCWILDVDEKCVINTIPISENVLKSTNQKFLEACKVTPEPIVDKCKHTPPHDTELLEIIRDINLKQRNKTEFYPDGFEKTFENISAHFSRHRELGVIKIDRAYRNNIPIPADVVKSTNRTFNPECTKVYMCCGGLVDC